jgi:hypothetical protein
MPRTAVAASTLSATRALSASTLSLLVAVAGTAMFLPPLWQHLQHSVLRIVGVALVLAVALPLHWIFLGIAARRMQRSRAGWVTPAVLLYPIGGVVALILLGWFDEEESHAPRAAAYHG